MCILQIDFYILFLTELINYMDFLKDLIFSHTLIFTYCLAIIMTPYWFRNRFSKNQLSNLSLTLGITGTFVGIFLGLLDFDTTNIESSVPSPFGWSKNSFCYFNYRFGNKYYSQNISRVLEITQDSK